MLKIRGIIREPIVLVSYLACTIKVLFLDTTHTEFQIQVIYDIIIHANYTYQKGFYFALSAFHHGNFAHKKKNSFTA